MRDKTVIGIIIFVCVGIIVFHIPFGRSLSMLLRGGATNTEIASLKESIAALKARLASPEVGTTNPTRVDSLVRAPVYSSYPFNFKKELYVGAGKNQNISIGNAVVSMTDDGGTILLGTVIEVFDNTSRVRTIFDTKWSCAVRIGSKGVQALLTGGVQPEISLIPKDAGVQEEDVVYSADTQYPYGLAVGFLEDIQMEKEQAYFKSLVSFPYDLDKVRSVIIRTDYVPPRTHN